MDDNFLQDLEGRCMQRVTDYDAISSQYDSRYRIRNFKGIEQALLRFVSSPKSAGPLEVGCGTGHWLNFLAKNGRIPVGVDPSTNMLLRAREVSSDRALVRGRAENLPFPNGCFDRVFCINAFHHFADKSAFLFEARRVLRPSGGLMMIGLDPHSGQDNWWIYEYFPETVKLDKERYLPTAEIKAAMGRSGFISCEVEEVEHITATLPARLAASEGLFERGFTSQLTILSKGEYEAGVSRLNRAIDQAAAKGEDFLLTTDLRLFGVFGWIG